MSIIIYCSCTFCLQIEGDERSSSRGTFWFNPQRRLIQTLFIQRPTAVQQVLCDLMHRQQFVSSLSSLQTHLSSHLIPQKEHAYLHKVMKVSVLKLCQILQANLSPLADYQSCKLFAEIVLSL